MSTKNIRVSFGEGLKVSAEYKGHVITTDQPVHQGGGGEFPAPFDLFLVSIATCAGFYVLAFCRERQIPLDDIEVTMDMVKGEVSKRIEKITITLSLPPSFPEKYKFAVVKAVDHCTVKNHIINAPQFEIVTKP
jgi:ribosomal protein S12 methylthiotransferase accessory factor